MKSTESCTAGRERRRLHDIFAVARRACGRDGDVTMTTNRKHKMHAADKQEMVADARSFLIAAGIRKPTRQQIIAQIEAEHGSDIGFGRQLSSKHGPE